MHRRISLPREINIAPLMFSPRAVRRTVVGRSWDDSPPRCIIFPGSLSPSPPRRTLSVQVALSEREERRRRGGGRGHRGEIFRWRYPGDPKPCCIPYAAGLPVIHGGLVTLEFRWRISAPPGPSAGSSPERRLSYDPVGPGGASERTGNEWNSTSLRCNQEFGEFHGPEIVARSSIEIFGIR